MPRLQFPLPGIDSLEIRNTPGSPKKGGLFGYTRSGGKKFHAGVDLKAPLGTSVVAAGGGKVVYAGWAKGYGNVVYIAHANNLQTRYAHLQTLNVETNQWIEQGELIGTVGKTGNAAGKSIKPHLHFEVRTLNEQNSVPQDPLPFLYKPRMGGSSFLTRDADREAQWKKLGGV